MKNSTQEKLKQIPENCLMIGIDPHKNKHAAVSMTRDARVWAKKKIDNSISGYIDLLEWAETQKTMTGCGSVLFGIEAGGHYWRNLSYYLKDNNNEFRLVNPFTLKRRREGEDLNRRKNDYRDAEMAAELLRTGKFVNTVLPYGIWADLRSAYAAYQRMVKESSRMKNTLKSLLDGIFPEYSIVFKNICGETSLTFLSLSLTPQSVAGIDEGDLANIVRKKFNGRGLKVSKLKELQQMTRISAGVKEGAASVASEIAFIAKRMQILLDQIKHQVSYLAELVDAIPESRYILSIIGIGYITVAGMLAELGSFYSYKKARQLTKMAGTNPTETSSAEKSSQHTPMSKKGRSTLRWVLWSAASNLIRLNEDFRKWARERRERLANNRPLHRREVIGAVCNRLLRLAYALVTKQEIYQLPALIKAV